MLEQIQTNVVTAVLIVRIQDNEFCFDMNDIQSIINPFRTKLAYVNDTKKMISYDTMEVPIIDFASIFSLEIGGGNDKRILILKRKKKSLSFFVDEVKELISFNYDCEEKLSLIPGVPDSPYLIGKVYFKGKSYLFPDIEYFFNNYFPN